MYLGDVVELAVRLLRRWEIAQAGRPGANPRRPCASPHIGAVAEMVGENGRIGSTGRAARARNGGTKWAVRARVGRNAAKRGGSRPISRVLSRTTIHLGRPSPCASSDLPGSPCGPQERARRPARFPIWSCSRWGLPCRRMLPPARCALTAPFHPYPHHIAVAAGGLLSVALSVGSRPPGVTWHPVHWSPDFPPRSLRNAATARPAPRRAP